MFIETDLIKIKKLSKEKDDENWQLRSFLKGCDTKRIDCIVHRMHKEISSKIDCKTCGNCCRVIKPVLRQKDIEKLSQGLKVSITSFKDKYLVKRENGEGYTFNKRRCPFLSGNLCSLYAYRPEDCRSYPHLHKKDFISRLINAITNCSICPSVFNVYEHLKDEVWHNPDGRPTRTYP